MLEFKAQLLVDVVSSASDASQLAQRLVPGEFLRLVGLGGLVVQLVFLA